MSDKITTNEHTIWSNELDEVYAIMDDMNRDLEAGEDPYTYDDAAEICNEYRQDEIANLQSSNGGQILVIANLGLWDGRHQGYKVLPKLTSVLEDLPNYDAYIRFYVDDAGEFRARMTHHDGVNYYLYRERKAGVSDDEWDELLEAIYNDADTMSDLLEARTSKLGPKIQTVYGWQS